MSVLTGVRTFPAPELKATMTGSWVQIGIFAYIPTHTIFDNLGEAEVEISFDGGTTTWKTFAAGSALVLDAKDCEMMLSKGMGIFGNGASGEFSVSYIYPLQGP